MGNVLSFHSDGEKQIWAAVFASAQERNYKQSGSWQEATRDAAQDATSTLWFLRRLELVDARRKDEPYEQEVNAETYAALKGIGVGDDD
jgi:hypothetical protein